MASDIDWDRLAVDLVRHVRGRWSQATLSERLGYASNVVYTWESGRRSPTASRFFAAAKARGLAIGEGLDGADGVAGLVATVVGEQRVSEVAARSGCSRHQLSRWLHGAAEPRLADLLRVIDGASLGLLDWLASWCDPDALPTVRTLWSSLRGARSLARASPWASAVLLAVGLAEYQALPAHVEGWIAGRLGIPAELEVGCMDVLSAAGLVRRDGDRYVAAPRPAVSLRPDDARTDLKAFWSRVALQRLEAGAGRHSWNLFSVSAEALARIEALQRAFYAELRREVAASDGRDQVALAVVHLVPLRS